MSAKAHVKNTLSANDLLAAIRGPQAQGNRLGIIARVTNTASSVTGAVGASFAFAPDHFNLSYAEQRAVGELAVRQRAAEVAERINALAAAQ